MNGNGNDFVHPTAVTAWQLIGGIIVVMLTMGGALWSIISNEAANNRAITEELRNGYVTRSNHADLLDRFNREVGRVDALAGDVLPRREFEAWKHERDLIIETMKKDIEKIEESHVSRREFDGVVNERGKQIDALRLQLDALMRERRTAEKKNESVPAR